MAKVFYARVEEFWRKEDKYAYLDEKQHRGNIEWQEIQPDAKHNWLTEGMQDEFETFIPIGNKETRDETNLSAVFADFSRGVETTRDAWVYNFDPSSLMSHVQSTIDAFNQQVRTWQAQRGNKEVDSFIQYDDRQIKWSRKLKQQLVAGGIIHPQEQMVRRALYRPYVRQYLYFDKSLVYLPGLFPRIVPTAVSERGLISLGSKEGKIKKGEVESIFKLYSYGNDSGRDSWVYNFSREEVSISAKRFAETYNSEVDRWQKAGKPSNVDQFVTYDDKRIKWTRNAKRDLRSGRLAVFSVDKIRPSLYRPFTLQYLHTGKIFNKEVGLIPRMLPNSIVGENRIICISGIGASTTSQVLMVDVVPCADSLGRTQCFPFYTYNEDGTKRRENISDWALEQFRSHYQDKSITKWDIFHYVYAMLHHPLYRKRYAANLKRELPRIPFAPDFKSFADIGKRLAEIHVNYEQQPEYPLERIEAPGKPLDWGVEKMKLSRVQALAYLQRFFNSKWNPAGSV